MNAARAEIIEREALYAELSSGRIRGAFDVFHHESIPSEDPIRRFSNVVLTPHIAYVTSEVYRMFFGQVVENLCAGNEGRPYRNALAK